MHFAWFWQGRRWITFCPPPLSPSGLVISPSTTSSCLYFHSLLTSRSNEPPTSDLRGDCVSFSTCGTFKRIAERNREQKWIANPRGASLFNYNFAVVSLTSVYITTRIQRVSLFQPLLRRRVTSSKRSTVTSIVCTKLIVRDCSNKRALLPWRKYFRKLTRWTYGSGAWINNTCYLRNVAVFSRLRSRSFANNNHRNDNHRWKRILWEDSVWPSFSKNERDTYVKWKFHDLWKICTAGNSVTLRIKRESRVRRPTYLSVFFQRFSRRKRKKERESSVGSYPFLIQPRSYPTVKIFAKRESVWRANRERTTYRRAKFSLAKTAW